MTRWRLVTLATLAALGCHTSASELRNDAGTEATPVGETTLTGGTVAGAPVALPSPPGEPPSGAGPEEPFSRATAAGPEEPFSRAIADEAVSHADGTNADAEAALPRAPEPTPIVTSAARQPRSDRGDDVPVTPGSFPESTFGTTRDDVAGAPFPETSFGSRNTEGATGESFPESSFGNYNTRAPGQSAAPAPRR